MDYRGLGTTGEAYLTNARKVMLTQSRLLPQHASLTLQVETKAPDVALKRGKGHLLINDYRNVRVFSSFVKVNCYGVVWVVIVEIDEDEVISKYFREHSSYYVKKLFQGWTAEEESGSVPLSVTSKTVRVDINEYSRAEDGHYVTTHGVATCTGVAILNPGKFAYLGHVFPLDDSYFSAFQSWVVRLGLWYREIGGSAFSSDLLGQMLDRTTRFDIPQSQLRNVRVVLVAVHTNSFLHIINRLLEQGSFISQIKVLYAPQMTHANIIVDVSNSLVMVEWENSDTAASFWSKDSEAKDLVTLFNSIVDVEA